MRGHLQRLDCPVQNLQGTHPDAMLLEVVLSIGQRPAVINQILLEGLQIQARTHEHHDNPQKRHPKPAKIREFINATAAYRQIMETPSCPQTPLRSVALHLPPIAWDRVTTYDFQDTLRSPTLDTKRAQPSIEACKRYLFHFDCRFKKTY